MVFPYHSEYYSAILVKISGQNDAINYPPQICEQVSKLKISCIGHPVNMLSKITAKLEVVQNCVVLAVCVPS